MTQFRNLKPLRILLVVVGFSVLVVPVLGMLFSNDSFTRTQNTLQEVPAYMEGDIKPYMGEIANDANLQKKLSATSSRGAGIMPPEYGSTGFTPDVERMIVQTGSLALEVKDTREAVTSITALVAQINGFVVSSNISEMQDASQPITAYMTLRVPKSEFAKTLDSLKKLAQRVTNEHITSDDRTEQKIDLQAQLTNLQATETQLMTIMKQAGTVEDTLAVQRELTQVRTSIERMQAQLDNLVDDVEMATINVTVSTSLAELPLNDSENPGLFETVKIALRDAFTVYSSLFLRGVRMMILVGPALLLGLLVWKVATGFARKRNWPW